MFAHTKTSRSPTSVGQKHSRPHWPARAGGQRQTQQSDASAGRTVCQLGWRSIYPSLDARARLAALRGPRVILGGVGEGYTPSGSPCALQRAATPLPVALPSCASAKRGALPPRCAALPRALLVPIAQSIATLPPRTSCHTLPPLHSKCGASLPSTCFFPVAPPTRREEHASSSSAAWAAAAAAARRIARRGAGEQPPDRAIAPRARARTCYYPAPLQANS